ncbi:MAG: ABC transporter ATP-binding protein [Acidimicrobiales bacterium]
MPETGRLEAAGIRFAYGHRVVVDDLHLTVGEGEIVGLRGPSGCGKTTVGRILAGHVSPDSGTITIDGRHPTDRGVYPVQLVLQHPEHAVNPRWRLRQILAEAGDPPDGLLGELAIADNWLDRYPNELSGGELQRIAVARALTASPRFLVADEISAMLDAATQANLWQVILNQAATTGLGVLAISHDDALLHTVAHRTIDLPPTPIAVRP